MTTAIVPAQPATAELYRQATDVAHVCREIVLKTAMEIQRRKYVRVEGWQSIATAHGCVASSRDVERVEGGVRAIGEIRRMSDGVVIATAEGFVGEDEPTWFGGQSNGKALPKRPDYAIRAMCQTRAISRACRSAFAHVVVLIDANLSTTPAEEVPSGGFDDSHAHAAPAPAAAPRNVTPPPAARQAPAQSQDLPASDWRSVVVPKFIKKYAGQTLGEMYLADPDSLFWWANKYEPKPFNGRISDADVAFRKSLDAAMAEQASPAGARQAAHEAPADEDQIPF